MHTAEYSGPPRLSALQTFLGSQLLAYWDSREQNAVGAQSTLTYSSTLRGTGTGTPPTVTMTGPLVPRTVIITYTSTGGLGVATYSIYRGPLYPPLTGTTSATPLDIGNGNFINFGVGTYTQTTSSGGTTHSYSVSKWGELTGLANADLTSTLSGKTIQYNEVGLGGVAPGLNFINGALSNELAIPALVSGLDVDFEVWTVYEMYSQISGSGGSLYWAFSNQVDNTKSYISAGLGGPTLTGKESRDYAQKRDSSGAPTTVEMIGDLFRIDFTPHVSRVIISSTGQMYRDGFPVVSLATNMHRGVSTTLNRFSIGGRNLGTSGFNSANWYGGVISAIAITSILSASDALGTQTRLS